MELIEKEKNKHHAKAWIPVYQEKGVYNFYLKAKAPTQGFGRQPTVQAMAAADDAVPAGRGDEDMGAPEGRPEGVPEREEE